MKIVHIMNAVLYRVELLYFRIRLGIQRAFRLTVKYQLNPFIKGKQTPSLRDTQARFDLIDMVLPNERLTCIDIGCNEGYFAFKIAERGGFSIGLDQDRNAIMVAEARAKVHKIDNVVFSNYQLDAEKCRALPKVDVIVFLSVFHHILRHNKIEYAMNFLRAISSINTRYMIFETGQPNEKNVSWIKDLEVMGEDFELWVIDTLKSVGYSKVTVLGKTDSIRSDTSRLLFFAEKF
jgi:2-polyprenyl-3-methyl-5-hydroxy-6-metoxy-1,4-benzoquinol methylase